MWLAVVGSYFKNFKDYFSAPKSLLSSGESYINIIANYLHNYE